MGAEATDTSEQATRASEAAAWFVRLRKPDVTDADRQAFRRWLQQDPARHDAFNEIKRLWTDLDEPAAALGEKNGWYREGLKQTSGGRRQVAPLAALAACLVAIVAGLLWRDAGLIDRAQADFATRPGERRSITLADGSQVYLDGDTAITVQIGSASRTVGLLRGRAWFDVARNEQSPFRVTSDDIATTVLGTAFAVDRETDRVGVTVERGRVSVSRGANDDVEVPAGQQVWATRQQLGPVAPIEPDTALAWRRGLIILDRAPLARVVEELEKMQPGRLLIRDESLRQLTLSGVFRADDPDAVLEALHSALGLKTLSIPGFATLVYR